MTIPKILHQIWLGPRPRPAVDMDGWRDRHPDWTYKLWTDADVGELRHRVLFDAFHDVYHAQADILRYEVLHRVGGVYLDADTTCVQSLDERFVDVEEGIWVVAEHDRPTDVIERLVANGFIGATREHPLLGTVLDDLGLLNVDAIASEERSELHGAAWVLTGPACLSEAIKSWGGPVRIWPSHYFLPEHHDGTKYTGDGEIFGRHWWGTTFRKYNHVV